MSKNNYSVNPSLRDASHQAYPRFDWDFQALDAFLDLIRRYLASEGFTEDLRLLHSTAPRSVPTLRIDPFRGPIPKGSRRQPSVVDLFLPFTDTYRGTPGDVSVIERRYSLTSRRVTKDLGEEHPWLAEVEKARFKWGLRAAWGVGALIEMMLDEARRMERSKGKVPPDMPLFDINWSVRRLPHVVAESMFSFTVPDPRPGMTDEQWRDDMKQYTDEGLQVLKLYREYLLNVPKWRARYSQMQQHVEWLFMRITPPYKTPVVIATDFPHKETTTISAGISKVAKMLGLRISPGVKGPRKTWGLDRGTADKAPQTRS